MNKMETIEATAKGKTCKIGKIDQGMVHIEMDFSPFDQWVFIPSLRYYTGVQRISNVADYGNGTGRVTLLLEPGRDEFFLQDVLVHLMKYLLI